MSNFASHDDYLAFLETLPPVQKTLISTLAHDVRNRMTLVIGYCEFIQDMDTHNFSNADIKEFADKIRLYSEHVLNIVDAANAFAASHAPAPPVDDTQG